MRIPVRNFAGFSLLELVLALALAAVLAAAMFPAAGWVRQGAGRVRAQAQFQRWEAAFEAFRQEYGHYPDIAGSDGVLRTADEGRLFSATLSGRDPVSGLPASGAGNFRRIAFHLFDAAEFLPDGRLTDPFGNPEIAVLVDRDLDGYITVGFAGADYERLPEVASAEGRTVAPGAVVPAAGVRAGVIVYSAGLGRGPQDVVASRRLGAE